MSSQAERMLALLRDGRWHSLSEIHRETGVGRPNSRAAELRKRGHDIVCERVQGAVGGRAYGYRLVLSLAEPEALRVNIADSPDPPIGGAGDSGSANDGVPQAGVRPAGSVSAIDPSGALPLPADEPDLEDAGWRELVDETEPSAQLTLEGVVQLRAVRWRACSARSVEAA